MTKAEVAALNKAGATAYSQTMSLIRKEYNITLKILKRYFIISKANKNRVEFRILAKGKPIPLGKFKISQQKKGVKVTVKKGTPKLYEHTFKAKMKSGHEGVFIREGRDQLPIKELFGLSPVNLWGSKEVQVMLEKVFIDRFKIEFDRAAKYVK